MAGSAVFQAQKNRKAVGCGYRLIVLVPTTLAAPPPAVNQAARTPWRAVDSPPRLRAKPVCFYASMHMPLNRAVTGACGHILYTHFHAESCEFLQTEDGVTLQRE